MVVFNRVWNAYLASILAQQSLRRFRRLQRQKSDPVRLIAAVELCGGDFFRASQPPAVLVDPEVLPVLGNGYRQAERQSGPSEKQRPLCPVHPGLASVDHGSQGVAYESILPGACRR